MYGLGTDVLPRSWGQYNGDTLHTNKEDFVILTQGHQFDCCAGFGSVLKKDRV